MVRKYIHIVGKSMSSTENFNTLRNTSIKYTKLLSVETDPPRDYLSNQPVPLLPINHHHRFIIHISEVWKHIILLKTLRRTKKKKSNHETNLNFFK